MLFAIAVNRMINAIELSVATSLCVDDISICYSSWSMVNIECQHQGTINHLFQWTLENGVFSSSPSSPPNLKKCLRFALLRGLHSHTTLFLRDGALSFAPTVKFLGLIFDSKLSWEPHFRWKRPLSVLKILSGKSWARTRWWCLNFTDCWFTPE